MADVDTSKPKMIDYDPVTNTSFGAMRSGASGRLAEQIEAVSSSEDFDSSDQEVDEDNEDEEGWGG